MDKFLSEHGATVVVGLILSFAIFCAFFASLVFEPSTLRIQELDLAKLKLQTEFTLERLFKQYCDQTGIQLLERPRFKDIVEHAFIIDENLKDQILGLYQIYLDLISNGTSSSYFILVLDTYDQIH